MVEAREILSVLRRVHSSLNDLSVCIHTCAIDPRENNHLQRAVNQVGNLLVEAIRNYQKEEDREAHALEYLRSVAHDRPSCFVCGENEEDLDSGVILVRDDIVRYICTSCENLPDFEEDAVNDSQG